MNPMGFSAACAGLSAWPAEKRGKSILLDLFYRLFGKENNTSKDIASERLRLVLVQDRYCVSADILDILKEDMLGVIKKYLDIDAEGLCVQIENDNRTVALVANIPIRGLHRAEESKDAMVPDGAVISKSAGI